MPLQDPLLVRKDRKEVEQGPRHQRDDQVVDMDEMVRGLDLEAGAHVGAHGKTHHQEDPTAVDVGLEQVDDDAQNIQGDPEHIGHDEDDKEILQAEGVHGNDNLPGDSSGSDLVADRGAGCLVFHVLQDLAAGPHRLSVHRDDPVHVFDPGRVAGPVRAPEGTDVGKRVNQEPREGAVDPATRR